MKKNAVILISVVVFFAILFLLVLPTYNKTGLLRGMLKDDTNSLKETEEVFAKANQLKQVYEARKDEINKVYYILPSGSDIPNLIVQLEALASENGLILDKMNFIKKTLIKKIATEETATTPESEPQKEYKTLGVTLSLVGNYNSFKSFLEALELNMRLMDIKSITFSGQKEAVGFTFNIELEAYYLPDGKAGQ